MTTSSPITITSKFIVISDIHNHYTTLQSILESYIGLIDTNYHIIFLGDLIHKGPGEDCHKVVAQVRELVESGKATCIRGNHDFTPCKGKYGNLEQEGDITDEQATWLKSLPLFVRYGGWLFLNGGMSGSFHFYHSILRKLIDEGHLPEKGDWTPEMVNAAEISLSSKFRKKLQNCMYARYVRGEEKQLISWGNETPEGSFWAEDYEGEYGYAIFGHNPWNDIAYFPCALGIDLGAGSLAADLDSPKHGLGHTLSKKRMCVLTIAEGTINSAEAYLVDEGDVGLSQFRSRVDIDRDWSIMNFPYLKGQPFEVYSLLKEWSTPVMPLKKSGIGFDARNASLRKEAMLGALLNQKYGFTLPLPSILSVRSLISDLIRRSSLNIQHAAGCDESPSPRLKAWLIESSLDSLLIGQAYGFTAQIEDVVLTHWMHLVKHIKSSEGYGSDFTRRIDCIRRKNLFTVPVVNNFLESLL